MYLLRTACLLALLGTSISQAQETCKLPQPKNCPPGQSCFMVQVYCIIAPCPRIPTCIADPCQDPAVCGWGLTCSQVLCNGRPCGHNCKNINDYTCPPSSGPSACVITPDSCLSDSQCDGPWEKCCSDGCGKKCKRLLQPALPSCATKVCAWNELCYMEPTGIQCITTPCPTAMPVCYTHPCEVKCPWNNRCFLVDNGCFGCKATAHCPRGLSWRRTKH